MLKLVVQFQQELLELTMKLIESIYDEKTQALTLVLHQDFDYALTKEFETAYQRAASHYILDMAKVTYLDSSALGLLLNLREFAFKQHAKVSIVNMNDVVLEIFRVLNFHKIFKPTYHSRQTRISWVASPKES